MSSLRVGILTGGGDCPGLNAVIRAVTKCLIQHHGAEVIGIEQGFLGLIERKTRPLSFRDVSGILTDGGTILGANNKANPLSYTPRGGADVTDDVVAYADELGLDALVAIGGDGTMAISHALEQKGLPIVGVPKTIDNDLMETDRTFGFDTAVSIATEAIDRIHTTAQSHHRVMIVETMGRNAGWIALHAGAASGSDVILLPEFPYDLDVITDVCRERQDGGQRFTIICVAEGAKPKGGEQTVRLHVDDPAESKRLGGVGHVLEENLRERLTSEVRTTVLGHMQRGGTPTAFDRNLATSFGATAASLIVQGRSDRMVALKGSRFTSVPLEAVAGLQKSVPDNDPLLQAALAVGTSFGTQTLTPQLADLQDTTAMS